MERGIFWFPRLDDLVVLAYLDDDPHRPLVIGSLWTTEVKPPYTIEEGKVQEYAMRTPSKIELLMHDEEKKHKVTLTLPPARHWCWTMKHRKSSCGIKKAKTPC